MFSQSTVPHQNAPGATFTRFASQLAFILLLLSLPQSTRAGVTTTGDVQPANPTTWTNIVHLNIGFAGNGTLRVVGGASIDNYCGHIGRKPGSKGDVIIDGAGSTWTNKDTLFIGGSGHGTLLVVGGGKVSSKFGRIGVNVPSSQGEVRVDGYGSTWDNSNDLVLGQSGHGTLSIANGGNVNNRRAYVGGAANSTGEVAVDGPGSIWTNSTLYVAEAGHGTLSITGGGNVSITYGYIGHAAGSTGSVTIDGDGSTLTDSSWLHVGQSGRGTLSITHGAKVSNTQAYVGFGYNSDATGEVTVDGLGSTWTNNGNLYVGYSGNGTLFITHGGMVSVAEVLTIDYDLDKDSVVNIATGGMLALKGDADDSIDAFLALVSGTDAIRFWDDATAGWANITGATSGEDYTLGYLTEGDLAGYTVLTVGMIPEPTSWALLAGLAAVLGALRVRRSKTPAR